MGAAWGAGGASSEAAVQQEQLGAKRAEARQCEQRLAQAQRASHLAQQALSR